MAINRTFFKHPNSGAILTVEVTAGETSQWIDVPETNIGIDLFCSSGSATVEYTSGATTTIWSKGTVTAGQGASTNVSGCSAIRIRSVTTGTQTMALRVGGGY